MRSGVKIAIPFVLALLIIGGAAIQAYRGIQDVMEDNRWVAHTQEVMDNLNRVVKTLDDAETGQRGFLLTAEEPYLEPYNAAVERLRKDLDRVAVLTVDNRDQQTDILRLRKLSADKLDELRETIQLRRKKGEEAALAVVRGGRGRKIMDEVRKLVDGMESREQPLLEARNRAASEAASRTTQTVALGTLLSLLVLGIAAVIAARAIRLPAPGARPRNAGRKWGGILLRYVFAAGIVLLATAARFWLDKHFGTNMATFLTMFPAVTLAAFVAGGGPGILATFLAAAITDYWFIEPVGHFGIDKASDAVALGIFTGTGIAWSILMELLRRSRYAEAVSATRERELDLLNMGNVMALDLDHRILRWSEGNRRLYGFEAQEAQGKLTYEFLQTHFDQPLEQITGELNQKGYWQGEVTRRRKDGTPLSLSLLWALRRDESGMPLAILEVSTDITPQKAAEEALRQQSEELAQQNEELTRQTEELSSQSAELSQQSEELSGQNEELQAQSEEIQAMNAELGHREKTLQTLLDAARLPAGEQEVMGQMCQAAMEMVGQPAFGAVVCERRGDELHILAHAGFGGGEVPSSWPAKSSLVETVMEHNRTACIEDASLRPDLSFLSIPGHPRFAAAIASPLRLGGRCVGAVTIYSDRPHPWTEEQFRLIEWLAAKCSNTLEAMRLAAQVRHAQEQNQFLGGILEASTQAFGVGYPDGRLGMINTAFERLTGYTGEELRAIDWARTLTPPEWLEVERAKLEELHRTGLPVRYEKEYIRKDGTRVPIELLVDVEKDADGKPLYYFSFITDITQRKRAEQELRLARASLEVRVKERTAELEQAMNALRQSEVRYSTLFEKMDEGFCVVEMIYDSQGKPVDYRFVEVNPAFEKHTGLHDGLGKTIRELVPGHEEHWFEIYGRVARTGESTRFENPAKAMGRFYDVFAFPVGQAPNARVGILFKDITEQKRAEAALREAHDTLEHRVTERTAELTRSNKELEQFAYVASHDLQEPLRQVRAFVQLLRDRHADKIDGKAAEYFQFVCEGAARMSDLVRGLLDYSRIGAKDARRQPVSCRQVLETVLRDLQTRVAESGARVTHDDLPTVVGDPTQLTQLFQNLVGNALKFHRDGVRPEVHVGCRPNGGGWVFTVQDNGIGIDPEFHEKVFLIFQRLHGRDKYPGTGIGLAICKKIVEQHGGRIWIESKDGQGSSFCFTLPEVKA